VPLLRRTAVVFFQNGIDHVKPRPQPRALPPAAARLVPVCLILESCPGQCDRSCYRCLRSYKNKFEHDLLDRHVGSVLLKYLLNGIIPEDQEQRTQTIRSLLVSDLLRQGVDGLAVAENAPINIPGFGQLNAPIILSLHSGERKIVDLSGAITPFRASDPELRKLEAPYLVPVKLINELEVQRNLPSATASVLAFIGIDF
jgi:hypothetical protein